jgi:hypothetical protein
MNFWCLAIFLLKKYGNLYENKGTYMYEQAKGLDFSEIINMRDGMEVAISAGYTSTRMQFSLT